MALVWIRGSFETGATSEANILPVIRNSDKASIDVNSGDSLTLQLSLKDLPSDWRTYLKPLDTQISLVETSFPASNGVIWSGFVNKNAAEAKGVVSVQVAGAREYLALRTLSDVWATVVTNPEQSTVFTASTWQGIINGIIAKCFSAAGIPSGAPKPPQILGTLAGSYSGTGITYEVIWSETRQFASILDTIRDEASNGEEYYFKPRWADATKTRIVYDVTIGSATAPHINEEYSLNIDLSAETWRPTAFSQSASSRQMATRIIGQSKPGDGTTGADITAKYSTAASNILVDLPFNPGVELTTAEMSTQLTSRLNFTSSPSREATFERVLNDTETLQDMLNHLGKSVTFTGSGDTQYFGTTMRIVSLDFTASSRLLRVGVMQKAARYPRLPKDRGLTDPKSPTKNGNAGTGKPVEQPAGGSTAPEAPFQDVPAFVDPNSAFTGFTRTNIVNTNTQKRSGIPSMAHAKKFGDAIYSIEYSKQITEAIYSGTLTSAAPVDTKIFKIKLSAPSTILTMGVFPASLWAPALYSLADQAVTPLGYNDLRRSIAVDFNFFVNQNIVGVQVLYSTMKFSSGSGSNSFSWGRNKSLTFIAPIVGDTIGSWMMTMSDPFTPPLSDYVLFPYASLYWYGGSWKAVGAFQMPKEYTKTITNAGTTTSKASWDVRPEWWVSSGYKLDIDLTGGAFNAVSVLNGSENGIYSYETASAQGKLNLSGVVTCRMEDGIISTGFSYWQKNRFEWMHGLTLETMDKNAKGKLALTAGAAYEVDTALAPLVVNGNTLFPTVLYQGAGLLSDFPSLRGKLRSRDLVGTSSTVASNDPYSSPFFNVFAGSIFFGGSSRVVVGAFRTTRALNGDSDGQSGLLPEANFFLKDDNTVLLYAMVRGSISTQRVFDLYTLTLNSAVLTP